MLPLVYTQRWRMAGVMLLTVVLAAALAPSFWLWQARPDIGWALSDKATHLATFLLLTIWYTGQYARSRHAVVAFCLLAFGALIEVCQSLLSYRTAEWGDLWADAAGIGVGLLAALLLTGGWSLRAEAYLMKQHG